MEQKIRNINGSKVIMVCSFDSDIQSITGILRPPLFLAENEYFCHLEVIHKKRKTDFFVPFRNILFFEVIESPVIVSDEKNSASYS